MTSSVKEKNEKILKMSTLIDQSDDSELLPPTPNGVNQWLQNYHAVTEAMPEEVGEPSPNQLVALAKRVFRDDAPPYVDFVVLGPYERKLTKIQKCRIYTPLGDGTYLQRDLPGPPTYQGWLAAWSAEDILHHAQRCIVGVVRDLCKACREAGDAMVNGKGFGVRCQ